MAIGRRRFLAASAVLPWALAAAPAFAADGRWMRVESAHFVVYSDARERNVREAVNDLERFDYVLRRLLQPREDISANKLEVFLFSNSATFRAVAAGLSSDVVGFYSVSAERIGAFTIFRDRQGMEARNILFHEYAHHFMMQYFPSAYPSWFVEGFAEFVQTISFINRENLAVIGQYELGRAYALVNLRWIALEEMLKPNDDTDQGSFYAQSWLMTHYIVATNRSGFAEYLAALRRGTDPVDAFEPAFGVTLDAFNSELRRYLNGRHLPEFRMDIPPASDSDMALTRLSQAADDLLPLWIQLCRSDDDDEEDEEEDEEEGEEDDEEELREAARMAEEIGARFPGDAFAVRVRARAAIVDERYEAARALLQPLVAADVRDAEAHYLIGLSYLRAAKPESDAALAQAGRVHFARAYRLNETDATSLYRYTQTYRYDSGPLPDSVVNALIHAHMLAPQVSDISVDAALVLMSIGRHPEAATLLRPVVNAPHRNAKEGYLARLLRAAEAGEPPPPRESDSEDDSEDE